jgi:hypothetical protein
VISRGPWTLITVTLATVRRIPTAALRTIAVNTGSMRAIVRTLP